MFSIQETLHCVKFYDITFCIANFSFILACLLLLLVNEILWFIFWNKRMWKSIFCDKNLEENIKPTEICREKNIVILYKAILM